MDTKTITQTPKSSASCTMSVKKICLETENSSSKMTKKFINDESLMRKDQLTCEVLELEKDKLKVEIEYLKYATKAQEAIYLNNHWQQKKAQYKVAEMLKRDPTIRPAEFVGNASNESEFLAGCSYLNL